MAVLAMHNIKPAIEEVLVNTNCKPIAKGDKSVHGCATVRELFEKAYEVSTEKTVMVIKDAIETESKFLPEKNGSAMPSFSFDTFKCLVDYLHWNY